MAKPKQRKRRSFTPEFKAEVVRLVNTGGESIAQFAAELDLGRTAVRAWGEQAEIDASTHAAGQGPMATDEREELRRLRREVKRLEVSRSGFWAQAGDRDGRQRAGANIMRMEDCGVA